ncbi:MAG: tyrosine-type recombinase/integrase [Candidatus Pacearchaeota archaeon]|jgi:integrase
MDEKYSQSNEKISELSLNPEQLQILMNTAKNLRDSVIVQLLICGARPSEVINAEIKNIQITNKIPELQLDKRKNTRGEDHPLKTKLPESIIIPAQCYNDILKIIGDRKTGYIILSRESKEKPMTRENLFLLIRNLAKRAGIESPNSSVVKGKTVNPYMIRHSGMKIAKVEEIEEKVSKNYGHSSVDVSRKNYALPNRFDRYKAISHIFSVIKNKSDEKENFEKEVLDIVGRNKIIPETEPTSQPDIENLVNKLVEEKMHIILSNQNELRKKHELLKEQVKNAKITRSF